MMKKIDPTLTTHEADRIRRVPTERIDADAIRIGLYYSKLPVDSKNRFHRIEKSLARKFGVSLKEGPLEVLLIRKIALSTVRIERAELELARGEHDEYVSEIEKWIIARSKEMNSTVALLNTITKVGRKMGKVEKGSDLRNALRGEQGLEAENVEVPKSGHERRHYDDITRTKGREKK